MKITRRIKYGKFKGYTIRESKYGWYDLYSPNGISQTVGKLNLHDILKIIKGIQ